MLARHSGLRVERNIGSLMKGTSRLLITAMSDWAVVTSFSLGMVEG